MLIDEIKYDATDIEAITCLSIFLGIVDFSIQLKLLEDVLKRNNTTDPLFLEGLKRIRDFKNISDQ